VNLTADQVLALAPDPGAVTAARKLGVLKPWKGLGRDERTIWGECQGSALYQVRVDLSDMAAKCTCPSRKFPCKHALGLMLVAANSPEAFTGAVSPEWVTEWLARRTATAERKEARAVASDRAPDPAAQAKRADQRLARVTKGLDALDLWLHDLVRNGLAGAESQPAAYWEARAARLVDAQAPALASRVRRLAHVVGADARWPARVLDELGRIALLTHAFRRLESLPSPLRADVQRLIGWTLTQEEVAASGEVIADEWLVAGQWLEDDERMRVQRTWLVGARSSRTAVVLQFAAGSGPFPESLIPGTAFEAELVYWPSASPQRALIRSRAQIPPRVWSGRLPGFDSVEAFLADVANWEAIGATMISGEKLRHASRALHAVLVEARAMAYDGEPHERIAAALDWAEYLVRLTAERGERTSEFRGVLEDLRTIRPGFGVALQYFDEADVPDHW
jgi:hypothetical protein